MTELARTASTTIADLARKQHGAFSRRQASEAGFTKRAIETRLARGDWMRVDYGIFRMAATSPTWHQRLVSACLAGPAVASHRSAAALWAFPDMPPNVVEVTALRHRRREAPGVIWHESYLLTPDQVTELNGIQVTGALRTFLDLAGVLSREQLEVVRDNGIRRSLFTAASGLALLERLGPRRRAVPVARAVLEAALATDAVPESVLETRFLQLLRRAHFPEPVAQYAVRDGNRTIHVDFAYPEARLAIELDGDAYHWGERADRRDKSRDRLLAKCQWRIQRFTSRDVSHRPDEVVSDVKGALGPYLDAWLMPRKGA